MSNSNDKFAMQFLSNITRILPKKLLLLSPAALLSLSVPFSFPSSAQAEITTNVVCYFQKDFEDATWQWGLNDDESWFELRGSWEERGITKFLTSQSRDEIVRSCQKSQEYYGHGDKRLINVYAANSSVGHNYAIHSNGQEVNP
jgi:hypothetical protein